jgi:hypothetical protein
VDNARPRTAAYARVRLPVVLALSLNEQVATSTMLNLTTEQRDELFLLFDSVDPGDPAGADRIFERFGPGNTIAGQHQPFERFEWYRELLKLLHARWPAKYGQIHKGTPFFFLAWLAFDLRHYEKALTYLDAAISEDTRIDPPVGSRSVSRWAPHHRDASGAPYRRARALQGRNGRCDAP